MLKYLMDLIVNILLPFGIVIVCEMLDLKTSVLSILLGLLPISIVTISYYLNKPRVYMKVLTKIKRRANVKFKFRHYSILSFQNNMNFNDFINEYTDILKLNSPAKISDSEYGELHSKASLDVDAVRYEFNYNPLTSELNFSIDTKITFGLFLKEIKKASKPFDVIARNNHSITFNDSITSIRIEFLKVLDDSDIKNPLFYRLYNDFTLINAILKYKTKRNTIIELNNNSISFTSKDDISDFVNDVKKQM